jgi:hypothetical protein
MWWWNVLYFFVSGLIFFAMAWIWVPGKLGASAEDTINWVVKYAFTLLTIWAFALGILGAGWLSPDIGLCK